MSTALRNTSTFCLARARIERDKGNIRNTCKWVRIGGIFSKMSVRTHRLGF